MELTHTLICEQEVNDEMEEVEIEVTVDFDYEPAERGSREHGTGLQLEPDWDENAEINSVKDSDGKEITLTEKEQEVIVEKCIEHVHSCREQAEIDYYERSQED